MGDLGGYTVTVQCASCEEKFKVLKWRGDRLSPHQLCEPCTLRGFRVEQRAGALCSSGLTVLTKNGALVRVLRSE